jgi:hypothetical protein
MEIRFHFDKKGRPHIDCDDRESWPQIHLVIRHLKEHYLGEVTFEWIDPITTGGKWKLRVQNHTIVVYQSEYGDIDIYAEKSEGDSLIRTIAESLQRELME